jgi:hypothetical protein
MVEQIISGGSSSFRGVVMHLVSGYHYLHFGACPQTVAGYHFASIISKTIKEEL